MANLTHLTSDLAKRIVAARGGMSQQAAAAELGVSARTFQDWEYGRALPQKRYRARLADWLDARERDAA